MPRIQDVEREDVEREDVEREDVPDVAGAEREPLTGDFEEFARRHLPALLAYATVLVGDRDLAGDVVQDVLVRAHGRWARIGGLDHPYAYVRRMVTNEYLSWRRRWHVRTVVPVHDDVLAARAVDVDDPAERVVDSVVLRERLARLPRRQRAVLALRHVEALPDLEIADLLGVALGTVRSDASRALATLRADDAPDQRTTRRRR